MKKQIRQLHEYLHSDDAKEDLKFLGISALITLICVGLSVGGVVALLFTVLPR